MTLDQVCMNGEGLRHLAKENVSLHDWEVERVCLQAFGSSGMNLELLLSPGDVGGCRPLPAVKVLFNDVEIEDWRTFLHQNVLFEAFVEEMSAASGTSRYRAHFLSSMGWQAAFSFASAVCVLDAMQEDRPDHTM